MAKNKPVEIKPGAYEDAILGFRNHWYPGFKSDEIGENETKTLVLLGENLLVKRIDGQVYAAQDACAHRPNHSDTVNIDWKKRPDGDQSDFFVADFFPSLPNP